MNSRNDALNWGCFLWYFDFLSEPFGMWVKFNRVSLYSNFSCLVTLQTMSIPFYVLDGTKFPVSNIVYSIIYRYFLFPKEIMSSHKS